MKINVSLYDFERAFADYNRKENFSYEGLRLLFEYFEEYEENTGEEVELDVISICCEYNEDTPEAIANNYWDRDSVPDDEDELRDQVREYLEANTSIVGETPTGFVYACF
jgi:hypothetical protein